LATGTVATPALRLVMDVHRLVAKLSGVFALNVPSDFTPDE
jgi:hypothetical protein